MKKKSEWFPQPAKKKVYEMPEDYKTYLQNLTEMLGESEEYKKLLPTLPPEAAKLVREFDENLGEFEQKLADEYEDFQKRSSRIEDAGKTKQKAAARIWEQMERMFILAKHRFESAKFKEYEASVLGKWSPKEKEEFYDRIAIRESYDLENILADPSGGIKRPLKHPQLQMNEAMFNINRIVYETDDFFKEMEAEYEKVLVIRDNTERDLWLWPPAERQKKREQIMLLDRQLDAFMPKFIGYLESCFAEDGKKEVENLDHEKLEAAFARAEVASDRLHLMYKHVFPHLYKGFVETSFLNLTPSEKAEAHKRIAKREAEELDEILASVGHKKGKIKKRKNRKRR